MKNNEYIIAGNCNVRGVWFDISSLTYEMSYQCISLSYIFPLNSLIFQNMLYNKLSFN
jgi:hypothetical protein